MSGMFSDREKGFERKYEVDQDRDFRTLARRDKLFGLWVAGKLGHEGATAEAYAKTVVESNFERPGDEDMLDKVRKDLGAKGLGVSDQDLNLALAECHRQAMQQIAGG